MIRYQSMETAAMLMENPCNHLKKGPVPPEAHHLRQADKEELGNKERGTRERESHIHLDTNSPNSSQKPTRANSLQSSNPERCTAVTKLLP